MDVFIHSKYSKYLRMVSESYKKHKSQEQLESAFEINMN